MILMYPKNPGPQAQWGCQRGSGGSAKRPGSDPGRGGPLLSLPHARMVAQPTAPATLPRPSSFAGDHLKKYSWL